MPSHLEQTIANVKQLFSDVFHGGNYEDAEDILTKDFTFQYPFPGFSAGPGGIIEFSKTLHKGFPGFELEINDLFGSEGHQDSRVAIRWTLRGTHGGDFLGVSATKEYVTLSAIGVYMGHYGLRGRLSSGWLELDTVGMLQQMRVVEPMQKIMPGLRDK